MKIVFNGELMNCRDTPCSETGWLPGRGIFETIKTVDGKPWALSRHMRRAVTSALRAGVPMPQEEQLRFAIDNLLNEEGYPSGLLRISFGQDGNWAAVHLEYTSLKNDAVLISQSSKFAHEQFPTKRFPYADRLELLKSARGEGADELILISETGKVSEGTVSNLIFKIAGEWVTPPIRDGALPGIMRALAIEYCGVLVRSVDKSELVNVESAFVLSSLRIAQPVSSIDGRKVVISQHFGDEIHAMALRTSVG